MSDSWPRLLGDVGGTNARFAWQKSHGAPLTQVGSTLCVDHDTLFDAIRHHLDVHGLPMPAACGIGIANPVTGDEIRMTNHHWSFSIAALRHSLGVRQLVVINDFTATSLSVPDLTPTQLHGIGAGAAVQGMPIAVLGPGTGLGVSGLLPAGPARHVAINGEGGHVTLPAHDAQEAALIEVLRQRFGHASAERALSGPGLVNLYEATATLAGEQVHTLTPSDIIERARCHEEPACRRALDHFCAFLGAVAGNLALTLGARGGVYVAGGIAPRIVDELAASRFRERFEAKGRFSAYLARIPTWVVATDVSPALLGASRAIDEQRDAIASSR